MQTLYTAYCINWIERERGWGERPDGHTLHRDLATATTYVADYWSKMPADVPAEYSQPGEPFLVEVSEADFHSIESRGSVWGHMREWMKRPETA